MRLLRQGTFQTAYEVAAGFDGPGQGRECSDFFRGRSDLSRAAKSPLPIFGPRMSMLGSPGAARRPHSRVATDRLTKEGHVKTNLFAALLFTSALAATGAGAQPAPFNATGVTMGHWHLASQDIEANK